MAANATILGQFRALSAEEKLAVIDELWLGAVREIQVQPLSYAERAFLDERLLDAESSQAEERDWEDVRSELLQRT